MKTLTGKLLHLNRIAFAKELGVSIHTIEYDPNYGSSTYSYGYVDYIYLYCIENREEIKFRIPFEDGQFNFSELQYYLEKRNIKMYPSVEYLELFL